jgi:transcriptional regulator GlxA family with amidase domain
VGSIKKGEIEMSKIKLVIILFIFSPLFFSVNSVGAATSKIGVLAIENFLMGDVTIPVEVFGRAIKKERFSDYEMLVISGSKHKEVVSEEGLKIITDKTIYDDLKLDVLIVPGAWEIDGFREDKDLIGFIKKQASYASWMVSNCAGAFLLGAAGVLDGKKATTWFGGEESLKEAFPEVDVQFDQNVVVDDNVITSNGSSVTYQATFELLKKLSSEKFADEISGSLRFDRLCRAFDNKKKKWKCSTDE